MMLSEFSFLMKDTHAYIDAGAMAILLQFLIGVFVTGVIMLKIWWKTVKSFFVSLFSKHNKKKGDAKPV